MLKIYKEDFTVRSYQTDLNARMKPSAILEVMQEAAGQHSERLGLGRSALLAKNTAWVLTRVEVDMDRYPAFEETFSVETFPMPVRRCFFPRYFIFRDSNGIEIGRAATLWVLLDLGTRSMTKLDVVKALMPDNSDLLAPLGLPAAVTEVSGTLQTEMRQPRYTDLDFNGHVNNTRYLDWCCDALGIDTMPVIVRDLTDEEAVITMVDSNLQREHILPSEKAFAYKMKMDAMKRKAGRLEKNSSQVATNFDTATEIGKCAGESRDQVFRYIRLTHLIPDILKLVDEGKIALTPAVELSYLQPSEQEMLFSVMDSDEVTPSLSQARRLRRMSEAQTLTDDAVLQLLSEVKGNQVEYVKVPVDKLRSFFRPDTSVKQMTETLVKAMDFYNKHLARQRKDRDAR